MAFQFNGSDIASLTATFSWGLAPASGNVTLPGDVGIAAGTEFVINLGALTFHGVVTKAEVDITDGTTTVLEVVDNRIKLMWDDVYASFNNQQVREDDPSTPGIDRQKRFWHIKPEDWDAQTKTWTDIPYTAKQIIDMLLGADTVDNNWGVQNHSFQNKPVLGIDASNGAKLGNVLQEISERQGLVFTVLGQNTLKWVRKGEGSSAVVPAGAFDIRDGDALSHLDTQVRLVGDRNVYQDMPVDLEPDWKSPYEAFWSEPEWFAEVNARFGPFDDDVAGQSELAAKAAGVTVREYADQVGFADYADYGLWGEVGRMEIPAWLYIRDIVFKAYRVPRSYTINGIDLESLVLREGMLAACVHDADAGTFDLKSPRIFYPDSKALVIAKGQQISLLDSRTQNVITAAQLAAGSTKWVPNNKFNLDTKNKVVIFHDAVFMPGADPHGLFVFPNQGVDGIDSTHELYHVSAPNAGVEISAAAVRAVLTFEAERYSKRYGSGIRKAPRVVNDLCYHALMLDGVFTEEVKYADGEGVEDKADKEASSLILSDAAYRAGGYKRAGAVGTALTAVLDRVSVTLNFSVGLVESVEHTKERNQSSFEHERELDRRSRVKDLFPGQRQNETEVENLQLISRISKELPRNGAPTPYRNPAEVMQQAVGATHGSPSYVEITGDARKAGEVIWKDTDGNIDDTAQAFAGVVIAEGSTGKMVALATQGMVPVLVQGPFDAGDAVGETDGDGSVVKKDGARAVGIVTATYTGTGTVLAPVRLSASRKAIGGPWEIMAGVDDGTVAVSTNSTLMADLSLNSEITITSINDTFTLEKDQMLYLQLTYDPSGGVNSVSLVGDDQWDEYPNLYHVTGTGGLDDPFVVDEAYFPIGYAYDPADADDLEGVIIPNGDGASEPKTIKVVRLCFAPLVLRYEDLGSGIIMPYPSAGTRFGGNVVP